MRAAWVVSLGAVLGVVGCARVPGPAPVPSAPPPSATASTSDALFVCGQGVWTFDLADTRDGLTVAIGSVRHVSDSTGPEVTLRYTATTKQRVEAGRPDQIEVLYLKDSVIVGGGPMLNQPGDFSPQGMAPPGSGFEVAPGEPADVAVATRTRLCPAFTWPKLWAAPEAVAVMAVVGQVERLGASTVLNVPGPAAPLLAAAVELPR